MAETTPTDFWNDSCSFEELKYAISHGAVGATTNPVIVGNVLKKELHLWEGRIKELISEYPEDSYEDISWRLNEEMAVEVGKLLLPVFKESNGKKGRISIQTNAKYYKSWQKMTEQALHFNSIAPNINVKMPATKAGIKAMEEATAAGVSINATVSFTVAQALAVAEAVERGLDRRVAAGEDISAMSPICTIMVGRLDDWVKVSGEQAKIISDPGVLDWAGVAAFKRAYSIFKEKNYRVRLLSAAYRNHLHWSQLIGGEVSMTIPYGWQVKFNNSDVTVEDRICDPVDPKIISELMSKYPEFVKGYEPDGLKIEEFDSYGAVVRTLRSFISGYESTLGVIREFMLPDPDK
ncbi:MAG: transaldolase family protein [Sphaerochaetaceae bacterium]|nr:transaldolase family protein [Sphaerochaetaceae bacterium]